jgi:hypothetical protein
MRKIICFFGLFLILLIPTSIAQDAPKVEIFAGYSFAKHLAPESEILESLNMDWPNANGWVASLTVNVTPEFGIEIEGSGMYSSFLGLNESDYTIGGGPKIILRERVLNPYIHALFGAGRASAGTDLGQFSANVSLSYFAMAFGGGIDWNCSDLFAIKAPQIDFVPMYGADMWNYGLRLSLGAVFRIN